jgi:hypothetical protein
MRLFMQADSSQQKTFVTRKWLIPSFIFLGIGVVVLILSSKQSNHHASELADDENDYDGNSGSTDEHWDVEELRHRLVLTQRKLTAQDRDYESKISRLDADVNDLLGLFHKRPRGSKISLN